MKKKNRFELSDMFEYGNYQDEPTFSFDWSLALIMGGFILFMAGIVMSII